jgi:hypothetical protein
MDRLQRGLISLLKKLHIYEKPEPIHINREEVVEAHRKKVMPFLPKVGITTLSTSYRNNGYPREAERIGNFHYCGVEHNLNDPSDFCVEDLYLPETIGSPWSYGNTTWLIEQKSRLEAANEKLANELTQMHKKLTEKSQAYQKLLANFIKLWNDLFDNLPESERKEIKKGLEDKIGKKVSDWPGTA